MKTQNQNVQIKQNELNPVGVEIIAQSIISISDSMKEINKTRLTREAIVVLIHDRSKISKRDINVVLNNLTDLAKDWVK